MTLREITIAGFALIGAAWVVLELLARGHRARVPRFMEFVEHLMRYRSGRSGLLLLWWWLGWHFLAR